MGNFYRVRSRHNPIVPIICAPLSYVFDVKSQLLFPGHTTIAAGATKKQEFWGWFGKLDTYLSYCATTGDDASDSHNPFIPILWIY